MKFFLMAIYSVMFLSAGSNLTLAQNYDNLLDEMGNPLFNKRNVRDSLVSDAISERIMNGFAADDNFGVSVSGAGDVNGDGYDDIIAGAAYNDAGGANAANIFCYLVNIVVI